MRKQAGSVPDSPRRIRTYRPDLVQEDAVCLDGDLSYAPKLAAACGSDGLIPVKLDEQVIVRRISRELYAEPTSALRELYANEVRACKTARDRHGASPRIDITIDAASRRLTIEGRDSLGIDQDVFLQVMAVLGRSDNFDGRAAGQFGMGFASYTCLSDIVIVETHSRVTGERYAVMGKSGVGFQPLPEPRNMDWFGTRITLTVRDDADLYGLDDYIRDQLWYSGIETYLHVPSAIPSDGRADVSPGIFRVGPVNPNVFMASVHCGVDGAPPDGISIVDSDGADVEPGIDDAVRSRYESRHRSGWGNLNMKAAVQFHAEDDDIEVHGMIISNMEDLGLWGDSCCRHSMCAAGIARVFIAGMPISCRLDIPELGPFTSFVINVKDERKYTPTPDRERFTEKAVEQLKGRIADLVRSRLPSLHAETLYDWHRFGWMWNSMPDWFVSECSKAYDYDMFEAMYVRIRKGGRRGIISRRAVDIIPATPECSERMVSLPDLAEWKIEAIKAVMPRAAIFSPEKPSPLDEAMMRRFGISAGEDILAEHGILKKKPAKPRVRDTVTLYCADDSGGAGRRLKSAAYPADCPPALRVAVSREHWGMMSRLVTSGRMPDGLYMARKNRQTAPGTDDLDDLMARARNRSYPTSRGRMTADEILGSGASTTWFVRQFCISDIDWPADMPALLVYAGGRAKIGLLALLGQHGVEFRTDTLDMVRCVTGADHLWDFCITRSSDVKALHLDRLVPVLDAAHRLADDGLRDLALMAVRACLLDYLSPDRHARAMKMIRASERIDDALTAARGTEPFSLGSALRGP